MNWAELLSPGGLIAGKLKSYEPRPQQMEMAEAVRQAFQRREHLIVEAGTGVGKSFAYLLPAIERATEHGQRVVVSTRTIALQEQLINKDIPFLRSVLPCKFSAELVKGRSNYVGLRRLAMASKRQEQLLDVKGSRKELWRIEDWAVRTKDGSLSDMSVQPSPVVWDRVKSEHDNCMGRRCPHHAACFYQRARRRAEKAQLLVVNHALFFSDLAVRCEGGTLLPDYDLVVLDEAHTVEGVAGDHLGVSVSDAQIAFLLNTLHSERTGRGFLVFCKAKGAIRVVEDVRRTAGGFFGDLCEWQMRNGRSNGRLVESAPVENTVSPALRELAGCLKGLRSEIKSDDERMAVTSYLERAETMAAQIETLLEQQQEDWVYWLETGGKNRKRVSLCGRPIDVSTILKELLFDNIGSVVSTSATLTTGAGHGFSYVRERLGLADGSELRLGSPFDYASQMTVHVEASMPDPGDGQSFVPAACEAVARHIRRTNGKALVLFTSYQMLNQCADRLEAFFKDESIRLLVQGGDLPRSVMLDEFRGDVRSVIFGTDSFWEGIDVVGEALSSVIVVKLPFAAPNRPDVEARIEQIKRRGGSPFTSFQLPEATLKFKQGVGRLIRSKQDRGSVVVLDPRVVRKSYGRAFLDVLPRCRVICEGPPPSPRVGD